MSLFKIILILAGTLSLAIGVIGIFVPGLPTTPFLLLTAGLYMRSSERLYRQLIGNRVLGPYISDFYEKKGMSKRAKISAIGTMWVMIALSNTFLIEALAVKLMVVALGIIGTIVMGWVIATVR
jgi:uncharacterized protein